MLPCPFCGSFPILTTDLETGKYKLECKKCIESGAVVYCTGDTIREVTTIWDRRFDKATEIKELTNKEAVLDIVKDKLEIIPALYGYLILPDGETILCDIYDHQKAIIKRFNLNVDDKTFDHCIYCSENSIVRISVFDSSLAIDLPITYTKKQKDQIFETLSVYPGLKNTNKFTIFSYKTRAYFVFYSLNEFLDKLDALKI